MVREYVRLGILTKALHPGRNGFDLGAIAQMSAARAAIRSGASLKSLSGKAGPHRQSGDSSGAGKGKGVSTKAWFWIGRTGLKLAVDFPSVLGPGEVEALSVEIRRAIDRWGSRYRPELDRQQPEHRGEQTP